MNLTADNIYNADLIVSVHLRLQETAYQIILRSYRNSFFSKKRTFYWSWMFSGDSLSEEELKDYVVIDNEIYYKPYVKIKFANGESITKSFETKSDAEIFAFDISKTIKNKIKI